MPKEKWLLCVIISNMPVDNTIASEMPRRISGMLPI